MNPDKINIAFDPPLYEQLIPENGGFLPRDISAHALWYYYLIARTNWEKEMDPIVLEGDIDPVYDYKQLFTSVAIIYGTTPEVMVKHWPQVDFQATMLGVPKLPNEDRYRFNRIAEIKTQ